MVSFNVTRRAVSLGSRDSWSGWRAITFTETTKDMVIIPQGASQLILMAGVYPRLDAVGLTADAFAVGDQVKDSVNEYWDIKSIRDMYWGDSFIYRECDLVQSVMYQADFSSTTWTRTRGSDPRYRTKVWLDSYLHKGHVTLQESGYVNCVASDISKTVTDDGGGLGALVNYNNTTRIWTVTTSAAAVANGSTMAITAGTGAGTSSDYRAPGITKDDDSTDADFGVLMNNPPYPVDLEFRGSSNMEGLFVVDQPRSTALMDALTNSPYGYSESVPVHILTVDSTACAGSALAWKMEADLRYICEIYSEGSLRTLEYRGKRDVNVGNLSVYDTEYIMSYKRSTTV